MAGQIVDLGPEAPAASMEGLARATGRITQSRHDWGLSTDIAPGARDCNGQQISAEVASQMHAARRWQKRSRTSSPRERRHAGMFSRIESACSRLSLPGNVRESASRLYRRADSSMDIRGRKTGAMAAALVYGACKQCGVVRSLEEVCAGLGEDGAEEAPVRLASRYYREMALGMGVAAAPAPGIDMHISRIANVSGTEERVKRLALELCQITGGGSAADGKAPGGVAAAYLYVASALLGRSPAHGDVSAAAGVTEVTIRNRCKEVLSAYSVRVTLRPVLAGAGGR